VGRYQLILGISTETLVALTAATASIPGSRPSSSAASRLSSETNRCGLDLHLSHHRVADNPAEQAAEPVPHRMSHHHLALTMISCGGPVLGKVGEGHPVHAEPSRGIGSRLDPARISPAPQGVGTDPEETRGLPDPENRHPATVTQTRLQTLITGAFASPAALQGRTCVYPQPGVPALADVRSS
jgi:hypothetical protein